MEQIKNSDSKIGASLLISSFIIAHCVSSLFANINETTLRQDAFEPPAINVADTLRNGIIDTYILTSEVAHLPEPPPTQ